MKKIFALVLSMVMLFSLSVPSYAASSDSSEENIFMELDTEIGHIKITYNEDPSGTISFSEYQDGNLAILTKYTPGNTYYERLDVSQSQSISTRAASTWDIIDFSDAVTVLPPVAVPLADNTRHIGYMHYNNTLTGQILSIKCHVDEWYSPDKKVMIAGTWGSIIDLGTFIVGAIGLPATLASNVAYALLYAGAVAFVGNVLKTLVSTEVNAYVIEQRIYGVCTSHSGKPTGDLGDAKITYVTTDNPAYAGETFYEGYTTHDWGTASLGRMMFWKVFGVEYVPTSWTGVDG